MYVETLIEQWLFARSELGIQLAAASGRTEPRGIRSNFYFGERLLRPPTETPAEQTDR